MDSSGSGMLINITPDLGGAEKARNERRATSISVSVSSMPAIHTSPHVRPRSRGMTTVASAHQIKGTKELSTMSLSAPGRGKDSRSANTSPLVPRANAAKGAGSDVVALPQLLQHVKEQTPEHADSNDSFLGADLAQVNKLAGASLKQSSSRGSGLGLGSLDYLRSAYGNDREDELDSEDDNFMMGRSTRVKLQVQSEKFQPVRHEPIAPVASIADIASARSARDDMASYANKSLSFQIMMELPNETLEQMRRTFEGAEDGALPLFEFIHVLKSFLKDSILFSHMDEEEIVHKLSEMFDEIDINGDGSVDWDEFSGFMIAQVGQSFSNKNTEIPLYADQPEMTATLSDRADKAVYLNGLNRILCCGRDKVATVLNTPSGRPKKRLIGHTSNVLTGCYVKEYNKILTSAADRSVIVWDAATYTKLKQFGTPSPQLCVDWHAPSDTLFSGGTDGIIRQWDLTTFAEKEGRPQFGHHSDWVTDFAILHDLGMLASASADKTIKLWDLETASARLTQKGHEKGVFCLAYTSEYRTLVSGGAEREIYLWNPFVKGLIHKMKGHQVEIMGVYAFEDRPQLLSCDVDGVCNLWDIRTYQSIQSWDVKESSLGQGASGIGASNDTALVKPNACVVDPHTFQFYTMDKSVHQWNLRKPFNAGATSPHHIVNVLYNSAFNTIWVVAGHEITIWEAGTGAFREVFTGSVNGSEITTACFDERDRQLILGCQSGSIFVFTVANSGLTQTFHTTKEEISHMYYQANPRVVVIDSYSGLVQLWDFASIGEERCLQTVKRHEASETVTLAYASQRRLSAISYSNKTIRLWKVANNSLFGEVKVDHEATTVVFAENFGVFITFDSAKRLSVYGISNLSLLLTIQHKTNLTRMYFSSSLDLLICPDDNGHVWLFDVEKMRKIFATHNDRQYKSTDPRDDKVFGHPQFPKLLPSGHKPAQYQVSKLFLRAHWETGEESITSVSTVESAVQTPCVFTGSFSGVVKCWSLDGELYGTLLRNGQLDWKYPLNMRKILDAEQEKLASTLDGVLDLADTDEGHALAKRAFKDPDDSDTSSEKSEGHMSLPDTDEHGLETLAPFFSDWRKAGLGHIPLFTAPQVKSAQKKQSRADYLIEKYGKGPNFGSKPGSAKKGKGKGKGGSRRPKTAGPSRSRKRRDEYPSDSDSDLFDETDLRALQPRPNTVLGELRTDATSPSFFITDHFVEGDLSDHGGADSSSAQQVPPRAQSSMSMRGSTRGRDLRPKTASLRPSSTTKSSRPSTALSMQVSEVSSRPGSRQKSQRRPITVSASKLAASRTRQAESQERKQHRMAAAKSTPDVRRQLNLDLPGSPDRRPKTVGASQSGKKGHVRGSWLREGSIAEKIGAFEATPKASSPSKVERRSKIRLSGRDSKEKKRPAFR